MKKIERIVRQFRNALDTAWEDGMFRRLYPFNNFPNDCCGHTCDLLSQYLLEHGIETKQINGTCRSDNQWHHVYMSVEEFLSINELSVVLGNKNVCDGKVLVLYSTDDVDYTEEIHSKISDCLCSKVIVIYRKKTMTLQDKMLEYEVLQEIKSDTVFFATEENKVLLKEIPIIEDDLYREIYFYIDTAFEDINERIIFYVSNNEVQKVTNTRISDVVDEVC